MAQIHEEESAGVDAAIEKKRRDWVVSDSIKRGNFLLLITACIFKLDALPHYYFPSCKEEDFQKLKKADLFFTRSATKHSPGQS